MPGLAVAAELGPVARLAVPVAELAAQRSFGFRRDRESVPGTRIDWHDLRCDRYHVMGAPEPLYFVEPCAFQALAEGHAVGGDVPVAALLAVRSSARGFRRRLCLTRRRPRSPRPRSARKSVVYGTRV